MYVLLSSGAHPGTSSHCNVSAHFTKEEPLTLTFSVNLPNSPTSGHIEVNGVALIEALLTTTVRRLVAVVVALAVPLEGM